MTNPTKTALLTPLFARFRRSQALKAHKLAIDNYYRTQADYDHAKLLVRVCIDRVAAAQLILETSAVTVSEILGGE